MLRRLALCVVAASLAVSVFASPASALGVDVVATDYHFGGIPHHMGPRVYKFSFTNEGDQHHMLVLARKRAGVKRSWKGLLAMGDKARSMVKLYGYTDMGPGEDATHIKARYFTQGRYAAVCFIELGDGTPHYMVGMLRTFQVVK